MTSDEPSSVRSHVDADLMVSLDVPVDWDIGSTDDFALVLLAPERNGFRANIVFSDRPNDPPTKDGFLAAIEQLNAEQARDFDGYERVGERRVEQDGCPGYLVRCRWDLEPGPTRVAQIAALYAVTEDRIVEVHCTALATLESAYLPAFQGILGSLHFLPTP